MSDPSRSVAQRLLNFSKENGEEYNFVLVRYGMERLLYRLSQSERGRRFILKGAGLFLVWFGRNFRTTRDIDLLGEGLADPEVMVGDFRELCGLDTLETDGLVFLPESVRAERIREDQDYEGIRVRLRALLGKSRIELQVDVGFGDAVTPEPETVVFPTLLNGPAPRLLAYPPPTAVAEKFQAMVALDQANSRMKDFYDLCVLFRSFTLDSQVLAHAIRSTFARRATELPVSFPTALTTSFSEDPIKKTQWNAFIGKCRPALPMGDLPSVVTELREHFQPVMSLLTTRMD